MTGTCFLTNFLIIQGRFIIMHYPLFIAVYYRCLLLFIGHGSASSWFIIAFLLPGHWMNRLLGRDRKNFRDGSSLLDTTRSLNILPYAKMPSDSGFKRAHARLTGKRINILTPTASPRFIFSQGVTFAYKVTDPLLGYAVTVVGKDKFYRPSHTNELGFAHSFQ